MRRWAGAAAGLLLVAGLAGCGGTPSRSTGRNHPVDVAGCTRRQAVTPAPTLFGVHLSTRNQTFQQAIDGYLGEFGRLPVARIYDSYVTPSRAWGGQDAALPAGTAAVPSFQLPPQEVLSGKDDVEIRAFFRDAPTDRPVFWNYYHEPEAGVAAGQFTAAQFRAAFRHIATIAAEHCRPNLHATLILMGWSTKPASHLDWRDYYPGGDDVSVIGWDVYNGVHDAPQGYPDPSAMFARVVAASRSVGKPYALAETGSALSVGDDGAARAAWLRRLGAYVERTEAGVVTYFNGVDGLDFRLTDPASIDAWRNLMSPATAG